VSLCVCVGGGGDISSRGKVHLNSKNIEKELKWVFYVLPGIKHFCSYLTNPEYLIISSHSRQLQFSQPMELTMKKNTGSNFVFTLVAPLFLHKQSFIAPF
jgi:hypothetical protein